MAGKAVMGKAAVGKAVVGKVVHFEIPIDDPVRAVTFYARAFDWTLNRFGSMEYWTTEAGQGEGIGGALVKRHAGAGVLTFYINVGNIDAALDAVEKAGGKRLTEPMAIPTVGWSAMFSDTEGNTLGLFQPDTLVPFPSS